MQNTKFMYVTAEIRNRHFKTWHWIAAGECIFQFAYAFTCACDFPGLWWEHSTDHLQYIFLGIFFCSKRFKYFFFMFDQIPGHFWNDQEQSKSLVKFAAVPTCFWRQHPKFLVALFTYLSLDSHRYLSFQKLPSTWFLNVTWMHELFLLTFLLSR